MSRIDFVPYPPTSFPFRDLLVLEHLTLGPSDTVCEIGVGSGGTTARLAKICSSVTGFEISSATIDALRYLEKRHRNLRFVVGDITRKEQITPYEGSFSRIIACDTLEHVTDPAAFFEGVARLLAPGGEFLVTFPNEPKDKMHGITRFDDAASLAKLVTSAGLSDCRIGEARLSPRAETVAQNLGWRPLKLARTLMRRGSYKRKDGADANEGAAAPQTFEQTHFMKKMDTYKKLAPMVNLYWYGVLKLMDVQGPAFEIDTSFRVAPFTDCQVFVSGKKARITEEGVTEESARGNTNGTRAHAEQ